MSDFRIVVAQVCTQLAITIAGGNTLRWAVVGFLAGIAVNAALDVARRAA